jgi:hypothetical protein
LTTLTHVVDLSVAFLRPKASLAETVDFQLGLFAPAASSTQDVVFSQLEVHLQGSKASIVIQNVTDSSESAESRQTYRLGDVANGEEQRSADLCWKPEQRKIFNGWISAREETELSVGGCRNLAVLVGLTLISFITPQVEKVVLSANVNGWPVQLVLRPVQNSADGVRWYYGANESMPLSPNEACTCR